MLPNNYARARRNPGGPGRAICHDTNSSSCVPCTTNMAEFSPMRPRRPMPVEFGQRACPTIALGCGRSMHDHVMLTPLQHALLLGQVEGVAPLSRSPDGASDTAEGCEGPPSLRGEDDTGECRLSPSPQGCRHNWLCETDSGRGRVRQHPGSLLGPNAKPSKQAHDKPSSCHAAGPRPQPTHRITA